jgi:hypothetical protein
MVYGFDFTIVGDLCRPRATRLTATEIEAKPASPFQSHGMWDQSWWEPATGELSLTQGGRLRKPGRPRKRKFLGVEGRRGERGEWEASGWQRRSQGRVTEPGGRNQRLVSILREPDALVFGQLCFEFESIDLSEEDDCATSTRSTTSPPPSPLCQSSGNSVARSGLAFVLFCSKTDFDLFATGYPLLD